MPSETMASIGSAARRLRELGRRKPKRAKMKPRLRLNAGASTLMK
jgi:hypothetical protein